MVPLNYNQLYYFYKIAECGSIAMASKDVLISSPALSMQLKELEEFLGTPLFLRSGKKLILTDAGSIVFEYAKDIFKLGHELKDTIGDRNQGKTRSKIEIGCQETIPKMISDELLSFLIDKKACRVTLREGSRERLLDMQREYKLDLILTNSIPQIDNDYIAETRLLLREELIVVGHPKWKAAKASWPKFLSKAPLILPTFDSSTRHKIETYLNERQIEADVIAEVEDKATEVDMALRGFGLITAMKPNVQSYLKSKELMEFGPLPGMYEEVWMILGKRKILNPLALFAMKNFNLVTHP